MGRIRRLDPQVINQIAAGEVVERPASVVKELVENSLDAGARRIRVDVEEGGLRSITVADDGCGMDPDDAMLAVERHATSKITRLDDLAHAGTLGFRGEALAAIASVARLELITRPPGADGGFRVVVEGGTARGAGPWASPPGTRVTVRDLFFNTPARRKHLKGPAAEFARIADVVTAHALARPEVRFELVHNGREVLRTSGSGDRAVVVLECFGPDVAGALIPVVAGDGLRRVEGYVGAPRVARASRAWQFFSINRRPVQVASLRFSLENAYRHLLPARRYPVAVVDVALPGEEVDVNVHPAKLEVRLVRERAVAALLYGAVQDALAKRDLLRPGVGRGDEPGLPAGAAGNGFAAAAAARDPAAGSETAGIAGERPGGGEGGQGAEPGAAGVAGVPWAQRRGPLRPGAPRLVRGATWAGSAATGPDAPAAAEGPGPYDTAVWVEVFRRHPAEGGAVPAAGQVVPSHRTGGGAAGETVPGDRPGGEAAGAPAWAPATGSADGRDLLRQLQPLGQVAGTYLACAGPDGLYLVDQHAAHERVYFERFLREGASPAGVPAQMLAVPVVIDLAPAERALLEEHRAAVARLGFRIEPFGPRSVAVRAVPAALADRPAPDLLVDLLSRLLVEAVTRGDGERVGGTGAQDPDPADPGGEGTALAALDTERAARILAACKAAIKAGDRLHPREMARLLADLAACRQPYTCPHGRPTVIRVGVEELERRFGRRGSG
ncbi:DNA mismatch repair protein MutL [Thermaerobacter marianensis DSM 12885]|uniref:DNA mismatch repair protein MutL n=1 Tax=Thermaerobacter marianensis (strain ATCC 700841 / DSM 12885 / JCM 10246 / 7p75a) TaxID=644966 RepID=E6SK47_THEM7|nr:DNA mismatch repair endonuclease MutL [Thermaerobacter marianensis]ADU51188.1 DNA mismatch repair protein MutL [Thermaerobacter marianensis DSM 12885]